MVALVYDVFNVLRLRDELSVAVGSVVLLRSMLRSEDIVVNCHVVFAVIFVLPLSVRWSLGLRVVWIKT